jgi:hypothetical protein
VVTCQKRVGFDKSLRRWGAGFRGSDLSWRGELSLRDGQELGCSLAQRDGQPPRHAGQYARALSDAGADLQVVMGYRYLGGKDTAAIELHPVSGRKSTAAAKIAGLAPSPISALLVQGDNRQGLGHTLARAIDDAGINLELRDGAGSGTEIFGKCSASRTRPTQLGPRL